MQIIDIKISSNKILTSYTPKTQVVTAIGNFDGLHKGHKKLITLAKEEALKRKLPFGIITFEPHPREFFLKSKTKFLLVDKVEKCRLIENLNVDFLFIINFNNELRNLEPIEFVEIILKKTIQVKCLFAGANFKFGKDRLGSLSDMNIFEKNSIDTRSIKLEKRSKNNSISSEFIRNSIINLSFDSIKETLGRNWAITGVVKKGDQNGRKIGFATANVEIEKTIEPKFGVYFTKTTIMSENGNIFNSSPMPSITNFGIRPTLDGKKKLLETHILNFSKFCNDEEIYGKRIHIQILGFLRPEKKFNSFEQLKNQIYKDVQKAISFHKNKE